MKAFKYDPENKKYICEIDMQIDPLLSKKEGKEIYLLPAYSTTEKPEIKEGFSAVWNGKSWDYIEEKAQETDVKLDRIITDDEKKAEVRFYRNSLINSIFWRVERYQTQKIINTKTTDDEKTYNDILNYIEYLRKYPESSPSWYENKPLKFDDWAKE